MSDFAATLNTILNSAVQGGVSDIHFATGAAPAFRTSQGVLPVNLPVCSEADMEILFKTFLQGTEQDWSTVKDFDGAYLLPNVGRFRFNLFKHQGKMAAVLRVIKNNISSIDELKLPQVLKKIAEANRGLVLVTGATGSGKSSTLAAMIDHINSTQACHVVTIEDPIEYVHPQKKSRISQREIGRDTNSFASALRSALRQDPDVILLGEMRDIETLDIALKAAETGHLVFSTVHTTDAIKTIGRLVALYPADQQNIARIRLSENLNATISQRLLNGKDGKSRVVAQEIMIANNSIRECIASDKKTGEMNNFIEKGKEVMGSQTFDQHISELVANGLISMQTALEAATNPADMQRNFELVHGDGTENTKVFLEGDEDRGGKVKVAEAAPMPTPSSIAKKIQVAATQLTPAPGMEPKAAPKPAAAPMSPPKMPKMPKAG